MVAAPVRNWRPLVGPVAFLLLATIAIGILRATLRHDTTPAPLVAHHAAKTAAPAGQPQKKVFYTVHAGDTLSGIAAAKHVSLADLRRLNPSVQPTALFLGEKIRLR